MSVFDLYRKNTGPAWKGQGRREAAEDQWICIHSAFSLPARRLSLKNCITHAWLEEIPITMIRKIPVATFYSVALRPMAIRPALNIFMERVPSRTPTMRLQ